MKENLKLSQLFIVIVSLFTLTTHSDAQYLEIPLDTAVRYGRLGNGLTYYIRHNSEPKGRAHLYIVQNVGAILEEDSQNGLAHFLEHMAFNGTKNFPGKSIINYMQNIGAKFGTNVNAYTSLDQTVYMLRNIPVPRPSVVDSGLLILHDWSGFISLDSAEIEKERGVIREEWRTGSSANRRMWKEGNKNKYPNSQYAKRDVIGDTAVINNFLCDTLRAYYKKWYRPDLQSIIVVGDIDADKTVESLKRIFADIKLPANRAERTIYPIQDNETPIVSIVTDKEAQYTTLGLEYKKNSVTPTRKLSTQGYIDMITHRLISSMLNERLTNMTLDPTCPFIQSYVAYGNIARSKDAFMIGVIPKEGLEKEAFSQMADEVERLKRFGFIQDEFERAKARYISTIEAAYNERDKHNSASYVEEYINHFLEHEPSPGIEWEYNYAKNKLFSKLDLLIINQVAQSLITDKNLIIDVSGPDKVKTTLPNKAQFIELYHASAQKMFYPYEEKNTHKPLLKNKPKAGSVNRRKMINQLGVEHITLSNGVDIFLKPTNFKNDDIRIMAISEGGTSTENNISRLISDVYTADIINNNGIDQFNSIELDRVLAGKNISFLPYISTYSEGIKATSSVKDFETLLKLFHLTYTTKPRKDNNAFSSLMQELRTSLANNEADPQTIFGDSISLTLTNHSPRTLVIKSTDIDKIKQKEALRFYTERFKNISDFKFIIVGSFESDSIIPLLCQYLGSIRTKQEPETWIDHNVRYIKGKVTNEFKADMITKQSSVYIFTWANTLYNVENLIKLQILRDILFIRYTETLREEESGTYGAHVTSRLTLRPQEQATISVNFDTDPELEQKLRIRAWSEFNRIATDGPTAEDLSKTKINMQNVYLQNIRENGWWLNTLSAYITDGVDLYNGYDKIIEKITAGDIKQIARSFINEGNKTEIVMRPY